MFDFVIVHNGS